MRLKTCVVTLASVFLAVGAVAQTATVKGVVKDPTGPVTGAQVQLKDPETGRKYPLKTNNKGEFFSIGISPGKYDVTVTKDGKVIYTANAFPVTLAQDVNELDIDIPAAGSAQQAAPTPAPAQRQQQQPKLTEEQKKQQEEIEKKNAEIQKENAKIGNLNALLKQAQASMTQAQTDLQAAQTAPNPDAAKEARAKATQEYESAVQVMQQAEQADNGQHDQVFGVLGDAELGAGKYPEAIEAYTKAIQIGSTQTRPNIKTMMASYYNNLGQAYARTNKVPEAVDAYNKAAEQDPTRAAQFYYNEGAVLTNTGKMDDANAAFAKAVQADPNRADAYYQMGVNYIAKGTFDQKTNTTKYPPEAAQDLNKYLELQPNGPHAGEAKALLDQMGEKVSSSFKAAKKK